MVFLLPACNTSSDLITDKNLKPAITSYMGDVDLNELQYNRLDFTCDGKEDVIISKSSPKSINDESITVIFATKHNGRLEYVPTFIKYNQKGQYINSVCGSHDKPYSLSTKPIQLSDVEKSLKDRSYCNTAIFIEAGGCKSRAQYVFMSHGAKGQHMSVVTDTP